MYIKFKESVLHIINEVINNGFQQNIELKLNNINRQLNELFGNEVFCYLNKYLYISVKLECIKIAIRFGEYNILISNEEIKKFKLNENWLTDLTRECDEYDRDIIQKGYEEQNYILQINCVKLIDINCIKHLVIQESGYKSDKCADHQYLLCCDSMYFKLLIERISYTESTIQTESITRFEL
jgi:hypothetical protein